MYPCTDQCHNLITTISYKSNDYLFAVNIKTYSFYFYSIMYALISLILKRTRKKTLIFELPTYLEPEMNC